MKHIFFLVVSLVAVLLLIDVREYIVPTSDSPKATSKPDVIDYYFSDFELKSYAPSGLERYQVAGSHLKHWQAQKVSHIVQPDIKSFDPQGKLDTTLTAQDAVLRQATDTAELSQNVLIKNYAQPDDPVTLSTDQLTANLNNKLITTDRHVLIKNRTTTLQGVGMESKLDEAYLRLHANVQSVYQTKF